MPPLRTVLVVNVALGLLGCGPGPNPNSPQRTPASAPGIRSLFEAECLEWRSFGWAKRKYGSERAACIGEISEASIGDCRANVTGVEWGVRTNDPRATLIVTYFFDEVEHPSKASAMCDIEAPKELGAAVKAAARDLAAARGFVGPLKSGERGFSRPTLTEYWTDRRGRPRVGIFYYPADASSPDQNERAYAAHPWTLTQFPEDMPISRVPSP